MTQHELDQVRGFCNEKLDKLCDSVLLPRIDKHFKEGQATWKMMHRVINEVYANLDELDRRVRKLEL